MKFLMRSDLAFIAILVIAVHAHASPQGRMLDGYLASERQFPYQVGLSLGRDENAQLWCGASYLSSEWILTAAHCLYGVPEVTLRYGSTNFNKPKVMITVASSGFRIHQEYNPGTLDNDIAMINTPPVPSSAYIWPVNLPHVGSSPNYDGALATATGWGLTSPYAPIDHEHLRFRYQRVIPNSQCAPYYSGNFITNVKMCVSLPESICSGDSGGPLVIQSQNIQIGIASFSHISVCGTTPSGFTRVTEFLEWIRLTSGLYS